MGYGKGKMKKQRTEEIKKLRTEEKEWEILLKTLW